MKLWFLGLLFGMGSMVLSAPAISQPQAICEYSPPSGSVVRANKSVRLGAYFYAGKFDTEWYANNFDLLDLNAKNDPALIKRLKQLNPNMLVFQQFLMNQLAIKQTGAQAVEGFELGRMASWLMKDTNGLVARSHRGPFYLMMDIAGQQGWDTHFSEQVSRVLVDTGADGVVLDEVPLTEQIPFVGLRDYPDPEALQAGTKTFLRSIRSKLKAPVLINAGQLHYKRADGEPLWTWLSSDIDGAWHEGWVRFYGTHDQPHEGDAWEWDIRSAESFSAEGKPYIASVAFRNAQELEYGIANYLLAIRGASLVFQPMVEYMPDTRGGFNSELVRQAIDRHRSLFDLELGCALESRRHRDGLWFRKFEHGLVIVNPTRAERAASLLNSKYVDIRGTPVDAALRIPAFEARILLTRSSS